LAVWIVIASLPKVGPYWGRLVDRYDAVTEFELVWVKPVIVTPLPPACTLVVLAKHVPVMTSVPAVPRISVLV
jgi:hypothetical protein